MATDLERRYAGLPDAGVSLQATNVSEALDFAEETVLEAQKSRRFAWIVAAFLIVICAAQAAAIALMLPLKDVVPYTIVVDRQTGYMETARGLDPGPLRDDEAVVNAFLAQYVLQRETFDPADFESRYRQVALWSDGAARADYVNAWKPGAAGNPLADMRPGTVVTTRVKQIEVLENGVARVRFDLTRRDVGADPVTTDWQATIGFRFTGAPMRMEDRLINPLGFQVTTYRRDQEFETPAAPPPAPVASPPDAASPAAESSPTPPAAPATAPSQGAASAQPAEPVQPAQKDIGPAP